MLRIKGSIHESMRKPWSEKLKQGLRPWLYRIWGHGKPNYNCPVCNYRGPFLDKKIGSDGFLRRRFSKCPSCSSTERHRIMYLVLDSLVDDSSICMDRILHLAPEACLQTCLRRHALTYHTADLLRKDVDFKEDLQCLSFSNTSYDCVVIARVLNVPQDLEACLQQIYRILKPGGFACIAETFTHEKTIEFESMKNGRSREIGLDLLDHLERVFDRVVLWDSDHFSGDHQLINRMERKGKAQDDYPSRIQAAKLGFKELVAICHKKAD